MFFAMKTFRRDASSSVFPGMQPHQPTQVEEAAVTRAVAQAAAAASAIVGDNFVEMSSSCAVKRPTEHSSAEFLLRQQCEQQKQRQMYSNNAALVKSPPQPASSTSFGQRTGREDSENQAPLPRLQHEDEIWSMGRQRQQQQQQQQRTFESPETFVQSKSTCSCTQAMQGLQQVTTE
jgi:hypothetical protein